MDIKLTSGIWAVDLDEYRFEWKNKYDTFYVLSTNRPLFPGGYNHTIYILLFKHNKMYRYQDVSKEDANKYIKYLSDKPVKNKRYIIECMEKYWKPNDYRFV